MVFDGGVAWRSRLSVSRYGQVWGARTHTGTIRYWQPTAPAAKNNLRMCNDNWQPTAPAAKNNLRMCNYRCSRHDCNFA
eukprot:3599826-Amphidinium_carterae.2